MYAAYIGQTAGLWIDLHPQSSPIPTRATLLQDPKLQLVLEALLA